VVCVGRWWTAYDREDGGLSPELMLSLRLSDLYNGQVISGVDADPLTDKTDAEPAIGTGFITTTRLETKQDLMHPTVPTRATRKFMWTPET